MSTPLQPPIDPKLLARYLSGEADKDEIHQIQQWALVDENNKAYLEEMTLIWESSQQLGDLASIDKKADWNLVREKIEAKQTTRAEFALNASKNRWSQHLLRIAAAIALVAVTYFIWPVFTEYVQQTTLVASDTLKQFQLPDGSTAYLRQGSKLLYHQRFNQDNRTVELTGEAFFEVVKDPSKPFLVKSGQTTTEVVGTSFNVNTTLPGAVVVTVLTGKVQLYSSAAPAAKIVLTPGEQGSWKEGRQLSKTWNQDVNFLSWKTGELYFRNASLSQVIQDLQRHYQKNIQVQPPALEGCTLTATFRHQRLEDVLEEIQLALPLQVQHENNTVIIQGEGCNPGP
ncbi:MAG: FecR domain-containing protein [Cytophagales bacterium]|nr:FecR domain-containing protein [Cytophagales bacterium]